MPLYKMVCPKCGILIKKISKQLPTIVCEKCSVLMERAMSPPESQVKEVLDNGFMPKRIERFKDTESLFKNREKK
jgi:hypothetical protein